MINKSNHKGSVMKKIVILVLTTIAVTIATQLVTAGGGSSFGAGFAGGMFGGMLGGAMVSSASQPRYVESAPQTIYVESPRRERVVERVVCVDEDGYEIPCPKKRKLSKRDTVAPYPDDYSAY